MKPIPPTVGRPPDGEFGTFQQWVDRATDAIGGKNALCLDAIGRVCRIGADFMRARDEGRFPVRYWWGAGNQTAAQHRRSQRDLKRIFAMQTPWRGRSWP